MERSLPVTEVSCGSVGARRRHAIHTCAVPYERAYTAHQDRPPVGGHPSRATDDAPKTRPSVAMTGLLATLLAAFAAPAHIALTPHPSSHRDHHMTVAAPDPAPAGHRARPPAPADVSVQCRSVRRLCDSTGESTHGGHPEPRRRQGVESSMPSAERRG